MEGGRCRCRPDQRRRLLKNRPVARPGAGLRGEAGSLGGRGSVGGELLWLLHGGGAGRRPQQRRGVSGGRRAAVGHQDGPSSS